MSDLAQWLDEIGLGQYADLLAQRGFDHAALERLDARDLERLGMAAVHREILLNAVARPDRSDDGGRPLRGRAERRHLTVLFCDMVGSTALSAKLDPEDLREILRSFQHCCDDAIQRYGGHIARLLGDGVLACFGYPAAHEDDAERAVNAALQIVHTLSTGSMHGPHRVQVRIGIASGRVVVGDLIDNGQATGFALVGEAPNLASRLQQLAQPNQILVAPGTHELLGRAFEFEDLGEEQVTGIERKIRVRGVLRPSAVASRFEARRSAELTPLVGRRRELALLRKHYLAARAGQGRLVTIAGEPGIGKSRLIAALRDDLAQEQYCLLSVQCSSYHTASAWYPVIRHLEHVAGIGRDTPPMERLDRLEALVGRHMADQAPSAVPLLAALLSIPLDGRYPPPDLISAQQKTRTFAALLDLVEALSREQPVVLVFEDVHWIDPTSLELLERIRDRVGAWRALVILLSRPEFTLPRGDQPHIATLNVSRLEAAEAAAMVDALTSGRVIPPRLKELIITKTDGVPLFVEEMTKAVLETASSGEDTTFTAALEVPGTLHDTLMARLDQTAPMKATAQAAAAIGREFSLDLLEAVASLPRRDVEAAIERLLQAGLLFRSFADQETYSFKHALVQDEAYASLLREERRSLHVRIAEALRHKFPELAEASPELVAHHYTQAGKVHPAIEHWFRAARQAATRSAFAEAMAHCQMALRIVAELPDGRQRDELELQFRHALGRASIAARGFAAPETTRAFGRALELCRKHVGSPETFMVLAGAFAVNLMRAEFEQCRDLAEELLAHALRQDDPTPKLMGHRALGMALFVLGELAPACDHLQRAIDLYDTRVHAPLALVFSQDLKATAQIYLALASVLMGDFPAGIAHGREALGHAEQLRHPHSICYVLPFLAGAHLISGEPAQAYPMAERTMVLSAEYEFPLWAAGGLMLRGWTRLELGDVEEGLAEIRNSVAALEATNTLIWVQFARYLQARALARAGYADEAMNEVDQILTRIGGTSGRWYEAEVHRLKGDLLLARADAGGAEAAYERAIAVAARQGARLWELRATNAVSALWRRQGRFSDVQARLAPLFAGFADETASPDLQQARTLLAEHA